MEARNTVFLEPVIYLVRKEKKSSEYFLEKDGERFNVPDKIYGKTNRYIELFWNTFRTDNESVGVLLTGPKGTGKSDTANLLCNKGLDSNMSVIKVSEIVADLGLISFIKKLSNTIIIFDEFDKYFTVPQQDKMLDMFSNRDHGKNLFIIAANNKYGLSQYLLDRPGRLLYHLEFGRVTEEVFKEYISDFNVDEKFLSDLKDKYNKSNDFYIDHLIKIVKEHLRYPDLDLDFILEILNAKNLVKDIMLIPTSVLDIKDNKILEIQNPVSIKKKNFDSGRHLGVSVKGENNNFYIDASKSDIASITDDEITLIKDSKWLLKLKIE